MTYKIHVSMIDRFDYLDSGKNSFPIAEKLEGVELGSTIEFMLHGDHHTFGVVHKITPPNHGEGKPRWIYDWLPMAQTTQECPICKGMDIEVLKEVPNNGSFVRLKKCRGCRTQWSTTEIYTGITHVKEHKKNIIRSRRVQPVLLRGKKIRRKKAGLRKTPKGRNRRK